MALCDSCWRGMAKSHDNFWTMRGAPFNHMLDWWRGIIILRNKYMTYRGDYFCHVCKWWRDADIPCDYFSTCSRIYFVHVLYYWRGAAILRGNSHTCRRDLFTHVRFCCRATAILCNNSLTCRGNHFSHVCNRWCGATILGNNSKGLLDKLFLSHDDSFLLCNQLSPHHDKFVFSRDSSSFFTKEHFDPATALLGSRQLFPSPRRTVLGQRRSLPSCFWSFFWRDLHPLTYNDLTIIGVLGLIPS